MRVPDAVGSSLMTSSPPAAIGALAFMLLRAFNRRDEISGMPALADELAI
jgi:hypothetical protein